MRFETPRFPCCSRITLRIRPNSAFQRKRAAGFVGFGVSAETRTDVFWLKGSAEMRIGIPRFPCCCRITLQNCPKSAFPQKCPRSFLDSAFLQKRASELLCLGDAVESQMSARKKCLRTRHLQATSWAHSESARMNRFLFGKILAFSPIWRSASRCWPLPI